MRYTFSGARETGSLLSSIRDTRRDRSAHVMGAMDRSLSLGAVTTFVDDIGALRRHPQQAVLFTCDGLPG